MHFKNTDGDPVLREFTFYTEDDKWLFPGVVYVASSDNKEGIFYSQFPELFFITM